MAREFRMRHRVEFADTDLAGIAHFSNYFRFMERTEHAFLRSLGYSVHQSIEGVTVGWPRVRAECEFRQPLRFEEEFEVVLRVAELRKRSVSYLFRFEREGALLAEGRVTAVCVTMGGPGGGLRAVPIPAPVYALLAAAAAQEGRADESAGGGAAPGEGG
jgi:acyl-CoA thioester hydrolase